MATSSCGFPKLENSNLLLEDNFENFIKTRLSWQKEKWEEEGESVLKLRKLINSMRYWSKKLEKAHSDKNIIVTLYNESRNANVSLMDFVDAIFNLDNTIKIVGYTSFRNPRYISISFESAEVKNFVQKNLKKVGEHNIVYLNWASGALIQSIKVLWYPNELDLIHVKNELEKYFVILEQNREETLIMNGDKFPSGVVNCKGIIKTGFNVENVPHLVDIAGLECLINIYGRNYLCLTCDKVGHRAKDCPTPFCSKCKKLSEKSHKCVISSMKVKSYAQKVRGGAEFEDRWEAKYDDDPGVKIDCNQDNQMQKRKHASESKSFESYDNIQNESLNKKGEETLPNQKQSKFLDADGECTNLSDDSRDDEDYNQQLKNMENHIKELQELGIKAGETVKKFENNENREDVKSMKSVSMEIEQSALKRKSDSLIGMSVEETFRSGSRRTYGRRGSRNSNSKTNK